MAYDSCADGGVVHVTISAVSEKTNVEEVAKSVIFRARLTGVVQAGAFQ